MLSIIFLELFGQHLKVFLICFHCLGKFIILGTVRENGLEVSGTSLGLRLPLPVSLSPLARPHAVTVRTPSQPGRVTGLPVAPEPGSLA